MQQQIGAIKSTDATHMQQSGGTQDTYKRHKIRTQEYTHVL
jgi:hypothetical protein